MKIIGAERIQADRVPDKSMKNLSSYPEFAIGGPTWVDSYYQALEFFYWEPQHLGRQSKVSGKRLSIQTVNQRLNSLEVTLNHNLDQFFRLAPRALTRRILHSALGRSGANQLQMHGRSIDTDFALAGSVQPDFLFESSEEVISIEMKIEAKSSISQVLKYALLSLAVELERREARQHFLVYLGREKFSRLWREGFTNPSDLQVVLADIDVASFLEKQPVRFRSHAQRFGEIVRGLAVGWLSYTDLAEHLVACMPAPSDESDAAEVYRNLLGGMLYALSSRNLT